RHRGVPARLLRALCVSLRTLPMRPSDQTMTLAAVVSPSPPVLRDERDGILTLTLDRPLSRNALSEEMIAALHAAIDAAASNRNVRVIILAANGPAFCAGHDLKQLTARRSDADGGKAYFAIIM